MLLAHVGHWATQLLYPAPVVAMILAMVITRLRTRGEEEPETPTDADDPVSPDA